MTPRRATDGDVDLLVALNAWVHDPHVAHDPSTYRRTDPAEIGAWFRDALASDTREAWIVEPWGYVLLELQVRDASPFSHAYRQLRIDQIAVSGDARRLGVGRALMEVAAERAAALGCERLVLDVAAFNEGARAFYEALGFRPTFHRLQR